MHGAHTTLKLTSLSYALLTISTSIWAADTVQNPQESVAVQ